MKIKKTKIKPVLGRGLSSLLGDKKSSIDDLISNEDLSNKFKIIPIELISPGPWQARKNFDVNDLTNLTNSIKDNGIIQPIVVSRDNNNSDRFLIIAGERRWRAAQIAKLHEIPVVIKNELLEAKITEISLVENLQRSDLNPIEEAKGYKNLIEVHNFKQEMVAKAVGKSRPYITNIMRLLMPPEDLQQLIILEKLSVGHVRPLIGRNDSLLLAKEIIKKKLSVRQVESFVQKKEIRKSVIKKSLNNIEIENFLTKKLGLKINVKFNPNNEKGSITISCNNLEQFDDLIKKIKDL